METPYLNLSPHTPFFLAHYRGNINWPIEEGNQVVHDLPSKWSPQRLISDCCHWSLWSSKVGETHLNATHLIVKYFFPFRMPNKKIYLRKTKATTSPKTNKIFTILVEDWQKRSWEVGKTNKLYHLQRNEKAVIYWKGSSATPLIVLFYSLPLSLIVTRVDKYKKLSYYLEVFIITETINYLLL